jgi:hypothetical protein
VTAALRPTLARTLWTAPAFAAIAVLMVVVARAFFGMDPVVSPILLVTVAYIAGPVGFLVGIGGFDYWWTWIKGGELDPHDHSQHGAYSWRDYFRFNTDHKVIGIQYIVFAFLMYLVAGIFALVFRSELARPGEQVITDQQYNGLMSQHGTIMIFVFLVPILAGIGNYVIPLMIGAADMAFPRLNAVSFWMLPIASVVLLSSFMFGSYDGGWTGYPTLSQQQPLSMTFYQLGIQFAGASSIATAVNFLVTIITMSAPGMTLFRMPLLVWANLTTSALVVAATPFIAGAQFMSMFDNVMGTHFFTATEGGNVLVYQHIFWFYSHPAVYIMLLPAMGMVSDMLATGLRHDQRGHLVPCAQADLRLPGDGLLVGLHRGARVRGVGAPYVRVWHGVLVARSDHGHDAPDRGADRHQDLLLARDALERRRPTHHADAVLTRLRRDLRHRWSVRHHAGGRTVRRLHHALVLHRRPLPLRAVRRLRARHLCRLLPLVSEGDRQDVRREARPRRVADYDPQFAWSNLMVSVASFVLAASTLIFIYNMIHSARHGRPAGANPWGALTLEWALPSPPPVFNFPTVPRVVGGPYRFGEEGAKHAVFPDGEPTKKEEASV